MYRGSGDVGRKVKMKEFYYIKFKPIKYDDAPYYLCMGDNIREDPIALKVFDSVEKAVDRKHEILAGDAYQATYMFEYYEISIERL